MKNAEAELYKALYLMLFNAITDALEEMYHQNYASAGTHLQMAQRQAEERYLTEAAALGN